MDHGIGRIIRRDCFVVVVAGTGLAAPTAAPASFSSVGAALLIAGVVVGVVGILAGILVAALAVAPRFAGFVVVGVVALLAATTAASATAPAAAPGSGPVPLVVVGIGSVVVVVLFLVLGVRFVGELDRLRRHEQRQVLGPLRFGGGLKNEPRLRLVFFRVFRVHRAVGLHRRFVCGGF